MFIDVFFAEYLLAEGIEFSEEPFVCYLHVAILV